MIDTIENRCLEDRPQKAGSVQTMKMPRSHRRYASPRLIRTLSTLLLYTGLAAAFWAVAYPVNAATRAGTGAPVSVPVEVRSPQAFPQISDDEGLVTSVDGEARIPLDGPQALPAYADAQRITLRVPYGNLPEMLLSRGDVAVGGLCFAAGALLLRQVLLSIAAGQPFRRGNPARIAAIAGLILLGGWGARLAQGIGTDLVLQRIGFAGSDSPVGAVFQLEFRWLVGALLALALAEAFRQGGHLARDAEGLI